LQPGNDDTPVVPVQQDPATPGTADRGVRQVGFFWWTSLATVLLDQLTKAIVSVTLPVYESLTVIPRLLDIVHVHNAGVAFGLMNSFDHPMKSVLTTSLALAALASIAWYARHVRPEERFARLGLSLILGGAVGNLIDRVRQGYVVDFVDVYWGAWHFWAFNVADAAISVGAVLVFVEVLFLNRHVSHPVPDR
jgi:signal peptidase II